MSKKVISEINFKKLKKVKRTPQVENLFRFFYATLYFEDESTFEYGAFLKNAMGKNIEDFQVRLARFQINELDREHREQIEQLKDAEYPVDNYDFVSLLEWIDYNYEAYLYLQQKEELENKRSGFKESDKKYKGIMQNMKTVTNEQDNIMAFLDDYTGYLDKYETWLRDGIDQRDRGRGFSQNQKGIFDVLKQVDEFGGNQMVEEIDNMNL